MQSPATLKRHAALVDSMARANGLDLEEQMLRGALTFAGLEDAVLRCTGCADPGGCERWLADNARRDGTPDHCRNGALFAELRART